MIIPAIYTNIHKLLLVIQRIYLFFICRVTILPIKTLYTTIWLILILINKMSGNLDINPLANFIANWQDGITTGEEQNNNWVGSPVEKEEKEEEDSSEYGYHNDNHMEMIQREAEWRYGITSIVRETFENEGSDVYNKAYEKCLAYVKEKHEDKFYSIWEALEHREEECLRFLGDENNLYNRQLEHLEEMVLEDYQELKESARGPVENTTVEDTAPVNDTSLVEDTTPVHDTSAPVEDTSAPIEDTETECLALDSVPSSPAAIATGQYTHTVTILESNLGVGGYRGLASGTQAEALASASISSTSASTSACPPAVNDPE